MEIAVFGGTFDPPTYAHQGIIEACLEDKRFDEVWVMPSGKRTDKLAMSEDDARLAMLEVLRHEEFDDDPRFKVSNFELKLPRPTQTYLTYLALTRTFPEDTFWFVFGADSLATMETWEHGEQLKHELPIICVPRLGYDLPPEGPQLRHVADLSVMHAGLSSTQVRELITTGQPIDNFVNRFVARWISDHRQYTALQ